MSAHRYEMLFGGAVTMHGLVSAPVVAGGEQQGTVVSTEAAALESPPLTGHVGTARGE